MVVSKFFRYVEKTNDGCWNWLGYKNTQGYGKFMVSKKCWRAHRWSYINFKGEIAEGLEIDHQCNNKACVNPEHLKAVTREENLARVDWSKVSSCGHAARLNTLKTHCPQGHPYSGENLALRKKTKGVVGRECKICTKTGNNIRSKRFRLKQKLYKAIEESRAHILETGSW